MRSNPKCRHRRKSTRLRSFERSSPPAPIAVATDPTGLNVNAMTDLRLRLREKSVEYRIIKNTLSYLAADQAQRGDIKEIVQGPTGMAFGYDDPVEVAKALTEYIRATRSTLVIRGGALDGRVLSGAEITALSNLPPRDQLVAQLLGQVQAPLAGLLGQLQAPLGGLVNVLNGPVAALTMLLQQRAEQLRAEA